MAKVVNMRDCRSAAYKGRVRLICRPTIFGNLYRIGPDGTREEVIAKYRRWFYFMLAASLAFEREVEKLRGEEFLGCWCAPLPCHGDVIVEYLTTSEVKG